MLREWKRHPRSIKLLKKSFGSFAPLLRQLGKSGYVFVFNLPRPLADAWGPMGNFWFYGICTRMATMSQVPNPELMASCVGPSLEECKTAGKTTKDNAVAEDLKEEPLQYPPEVARRAVGGGWSSKINFYRDGLFFKRWDKSMETLWALTQEEQGESLAANRRSSAGAALFDSGPKGSLKAKATIIWGAKDPAGESRVALEGVEDYLARGSQILSLEKTGHWIPIEKDGKVVLEEVVKWAVDGERQKLKEVVTADPSWHVKILAER